MLGEVRIKRGTFHRDSLSLLLFLLAMIPLNIWWKRKNIGYKFGEEQKMINNLLYMDDDLKLYGRSDVVRVFSRDIRMQFQLGKCAVLVLNKG